jgi:hypothetical protein
MEVEVPTLEEQEVLKISRHSHMDSEDGKVPFRQFSYNDSECFKKSTEQLWRDIYQYPSGDSFFRKNKNQREDKEVSNEHTIPSAREAWSVYDPEK